MAVSRLRWAVNTSLWIPSEQEWLSALSIIQAEEVKRIGHFVFQRDAKFALVGRLLIWAGLSEHMGGVDTLKGCKLERSERGKPLLLNAMGHEEDSVHFNISHQGDYVVLATERGRDVQVGVDIMDMSQLRGSSSRQEFFRLMRRQFTDKEWLQIVPPSLHVESKQLSNFYRFWCLKESFIKADGSGLSYGLQNLEFTAGPEWPSDENCCVSSRLYIKGMPATNWTFQESVLDKHCVSVAICGVQSDMAPVFSCVSVQSLLSKLGHKVTSPLTFAREWETFKQKQLHFINETSSD